MNKEITCKIIQDLLPNYIENLTNKETTQYIEEHIHNCNECNEALKNMNTNIKTETNFNKDINYLKKFNKKLKNLKLFLLVVIVVFIFIISRKVLIISDLYNKAENSRNIDIDNQYSKISTYSLGTLSTIEVYSKDNNFLAKLDNYKYGNSYKDEEVTNSIGYKFENENIILINYPNGKKVMYSDEKELHTSIFPISAEYLYNEQIQFFLFSNIQKVILQGKECYMIKYKNTEQFIEIETGLTIKKIDNDTNTVVDYYYEFGTVEDEDIIRPDTTGYIKSE